MPQEVDVRLHVQFKPLTERDLSFPGNGDDSVTNSRLY